MKINKKGKEMNTNPNCEITEKVNSENYHCKFEYEDGNMMEYKFKCSKDILYFLLKNYEIINTIELKTLFDYVRYKSLFGEYTIEDIAVLLKLEVIITFIVSNHKPEYGTSGIDATKLVINSYNNTGLNIYNQKLKKTIELAELYAEDNKEKVFVQKTNNGIPKIEEVSLKCDTKLDINHKDILYSSEFNSYSNLYKVVYSNGFLLAYKTIENIFFVVSELNSCKINVEKRL